MCERTLLLVLCNTNATLISVYPAIKAMKDKMTAAVITFSPTMLLTAVPCCGTRSPFRLRDLLFKSGIPGLFFMSLSLFHVSPAPEATSHQRRALGCFFFFFSPV